VAPQGHTNHAAAARFLITGATKGIGRALSERLVRYGHQVVGFARGPDPDFLGELVSVDLADPAATATALDDAVRRQRLAGVVNNVGCGRSHWARSGWTTLQRCWT
jgi:NAD(P)-dependent dehydrogenase (short-subunit alcohol dehydrogenase family)